MTGPLDMTGVLPDTLRHFGGLMDSIVAYLEPIRQAALGLPTVTGRGPEGEEFIKAYNDFRRAGVKAVESMELFVRQTGGQLISDADAWRSVDIRSLDVVMGEFGKGRTPGR